MGLFQHKQKSDDDNAEIEQFFDENFREELRNHGRWYFEKIIKENSVLFKEDLKSTIDGVAIDLKERTEAQLDEVIVQINTELKESVTKQLEGQFADYSKSAKEAQDKALDSLTQSASGLEQQHKDLASIIQKSIANQTLMLESLFQENMAKIAAVKEANDAALQSLNRSISELEEQNKHLSEALETKIAKQEESMIQAFESNMAQVVEHYLLGALGDAYDLKTQLPSIIKQMEENKDAIAEDMKL